MTTAGERGKLRLGVVGYCPPTRFDETKGLEMVQASYNAVMGDFPGWEITVVSGLTNVGVLRLAYEEAKRRGWRTAGVACEKAYALRDQWFPVDEEPLIVGKEWGEESETFLTSIDALVRIGGGPQSRREAKLARVMRKPTYEYELSRLN